MAPPSKQKTEHEEVQSANLEANDGNERTTDPIGRNLESGDKEIGNKIESNTQSKIESQREVKDEPERNEVKNPKTNAKTENCPETVCEKAQVKTSTKIGGQLSLLLVPGYGWAAARVEGGLMRIGVKLTSDLRLDNYGT
nr:hypothetical protein Iba_chr12bCG0010 [Ipomoea batatas]